MPALIEKRKVLQSMVPPETAFGTTYHSLCIPPFPGSILLLGWGEGTIPWLIRKVWGQAPTIHGVDVRAPELSYTDFILSNSQSTFLIAKAEEYVKSSEPYDIVIVDLYNGSEIPDFVFQKDFIRDLSRITKKLLIVNCTFYLWKHFESYDEFFAVDAVKQVNREKVLFYCPVKKMEVI